MAKTTTASGRREFLGALGLGLLTMNQGSAADDKSPAVRGKSPGADGKSPAAGGEEVIPFLDAPKFDPQRPTQPWDKLDSWVTPGEHLFAVAHYGMADVNPQTWKLEISGLVDRPRSFNLDALRARHKKHHTVTLECSGNGPAGGLVGNMQWSGTPLAPILKECGLKPDATEVVFFGVDQGTEKIRDNDYKQNFARSLAVPEALRENAFLAYEMNGEPLPKNHGAPVRLVVPGWYGVAWVKWLNRIEVHDRAYLNRFMGRDYVTIRGEKHGDETVWRETSVGRMNLKSVPARVTRGSDGALRIAGAAWSDGTAIRGVELKIDDGPWKAARITPNRDNPYAWTFWSYDWMDAKPGEHTISSRATDVRGRVQPAPDDPFVTLKKTRWENYQQALRKIRV